MAGFNETDITAALKKYREFLEQVGVWDLLRPPSPGSCAPRSPPLGLIQ
jgi:hypothetical protein